MRLDIPNDIWHQGAPTGSRPIFYHCYKDGNYYYLQYWYFFNCNDIRVPSNVDAYHEGDIEHVTLKITFENYNFVPTSLNFYQHEGGHTKIPSECYWSSTNNSNWNFQIGYTEQRTHLHVWLAANSHALYNLNDYVYRFTLDLGVITEDYTDNCDYSNMEPNLYFEYDILKKLGEADFEWYPDQSKTHGYSYWFHYFPKGGEDWIIFRGNF